MLRRRLARFADRGAPGRHRARAGASARPDLRRGVRSPSPSGCASSWRTAAAGSPRRSTPSATRRWAASTPSSRVLPRSRSCPRSSTSTLSTRRSRTVREGRHRGQRPARPPRQRRRAGPDAVGLAGRDGRLHVGSIAATGAVLAFGTDARSSRSIRTGDRAAVRREDRRWPAGTPEFGPTRHSPSSRRSGRHVSDRRCPRARPIAGDRPSASAPILR
jgi:hypothetical protein